MKKYILSIVCMFALLGCSIVDKVADLTPSQATLATMAIKAGTIELIVKDVSKSTETAKTIVSVVTEATSYISGGTVTIISDLDNKLHERIAKLNLSPSKQLIVDTLITLVKAKIETDITGDVLNADTVVVINKVLLIIKTTAEAYD